MTAVLLRGTDGTVVPLDVAAWRRSADPSDVRVLSTVEDPVLDIGCGPGRITAALADQGRFALGIDPASLAVAETRRRGGLALQRSVFRPLPGEGRWGSALLLDGNIGIGGDPVALLRRCAELVRPIEGVVLAELDEPGAPSASRAVRVERGDAAGPWFRWASVGADRWPEVVDAAGLGAATVERHGGRWFGRAVRR